MNGRLLVCDDDLHIALAVSMKLKRAGFDVQLAADGAEAWDRLQAEPFDLLITDCQMPRMDGLELVRRIQADPTLSGLPSIMLTAKGLELEMSDLRALGVRELVFKPFSPRDLLRTVEGLLTGGDSVARALAVAEQGTH